jgi:hypothetical protein
MEGSTVRDGKYATHIRRAVDWLTALCQPNGLIGNPSGTEAGRYMFGHSYAQLFLAQVYGDERDPERQQKLQDVLTRSVVFSGRAQSSRGGWGYVAAAEGGDFDHGPNTVIQLQALRAIHHAGIPVPKDVIDKADTCLKRSTRDGDGVVYSLVGGGLEGRPAVTAGALAAYSDGYDADLPRRWLKFCTTHIRLLDRDSGRSGYDEFTHYYYAQVIYRLGDDGYARLFPDSKPAGRPTWRRYRQGLLEFLASKQNEDGSWNLGYIGAVYSTSCYLAILQLHREVLPFYRR